MPKPGPACQRGPACQSQAQHAKEAQHAKARVGEAQHAKAPPSVMAPLRPLTVIIRQAAAKPSPSRTTAPSPYAPPATFTATNTITQAAATPQPGKHKRPAAEP